MKLAGLVGVLLLLEVCLFVNAVDEQNATSNSTIPIIVITWDYKDATQKGIFISVLPVLTRYVIQHSTTSATEHCLN